MDIRDLPAREPGTLAGFEAICPRCGLVLRSSLRSALELDIVEHEAWDALRETNAGRPLAERTSFPVPDGTTLR